MHICIHALPQEEKRVKVGKSRNFKSREYQESIPWYYPTILSGVMTIWSRPRIPRVLSGFGLRYWERPKNMWGGEDHKASVCKWKEFLRNTSIWSIFDGIGVMLVIWSEIFCAPRIQCWIRVMRSKMNYHWMIWFWLD